MPGGNRRIGVVTELGRYHAARHVDGRHILSCNACRRDQASGPIVARKRPVIGYEIPDSGARAICERDALGYLRADCVVLIGRQGDRSQYGDDRYNNHQFDESESSGNSRHKNPPALSHIVQDACQKVTMDRTESPLWVGPKWHR